MYVGMYVRNTHFSCPFFNESCIGEIVIRVGTYLDVRALGVLRSIE